MRRFELEPFLAAIEKFQITDTIAVPPMAIQIIMSELTSKYSLESIKTILLGAAPLGLESQNRLLQLLPKDARAVQVWGSKYSLVL
jgi:4-coumarate--CoA ligase